MMRKPKPQPIFADHVHFGRGQILAVRKLAPQYWKSSIADLTPTPTPKPKRVKMTAEPEAA